MSQKPTGKFIVVEGLDGAGKTSLITDLKDLMLELEQPFLLTQGIGGTPYGMALRKIVLSPMGADLSPEAQCMLFMSACRELVDTTILPALMEGRWIICDRFHMSTYTYQHDSQRLAMLMLLGTRGLLPDLTLHLDVDYITSQKRKALVQSVPDHFDHASKMVFDKRRKHMLEYIAKHQSSETILNIPTHTGATYSDVRRTAIDAIMTLREATEK